MIEFHRRPQKLDRPGRRDQRRLSLLVLSLGLVFLFMREVRRPERWRWLIQLDARQAGTAPRGAQEIPPPLPAGTRMDVERETPRVAVVDLTAVRDDTYLRPQEHTAWFGLLGELARAQGQDLVASAPRRPTFRELERQPEAFRGQLITLMGRVRLVAAKQAPANAEGIGTYWQLWLQPPDQPSALVAIYCLELPEGFPRQGPTDEAVNVTGYFFKRWAYQAQDAIRTAPLVLARTIAWQPTLPVARTPRKNWYGAVIAVSAALLAGLLMAFVYARGREHDRLKHYLSDSGDMSLLVQDNPAEVTGVDDSAVSHHGGWKQQT